MDSSLVAVDTSSRTVVDLTGEVEEFAPPGDGLVNVFAPHATAGPALMEVGSGSEHDLEETLHRLLPRDDRYRHRHGAQGHGADHVLPALVSPSLTIPRPGRTPAARHLAEYRPGRRQPRQPQSPGPAQLHRRIGVRSGPARTGGPECPVVLGCL